jgi:hypothetical protein
LIRCSEGYWLRLRAQAAHDLELQRRAIGPQLNQIRPLAAIGS